MCPFVPIVEATLEVVQDNRAIWNGRRQFGLRIEEATEYPEFKKLDDDGSGYAHGRGDEAALVVRHDPETNTRAIGKPRH